MHSFVFNSGRHLLFSWTFLAVNFFCFVWRPFTFSFDAFRRIFLSSSVAQHIYNVYFYNSPQYQKFRKFFLLSFGELNIYSWFVFCSKYSNNNMFIYLFLNLSIISLYLSPNHSPNFRLFSCILLSFFFFSFSLYFFHYPFSFSV